jgi:spermidine synthase
VLRLARRGNEYSIAVVGKPGDLMNSRAHGSEEELARLGLAALGAKAAPRVLVGGMGMGFTLAAVLRELDAASADVARGSEESDSPGSKGAAGAEGHRTAEVPTAEDPKHQGLLAEVTVAELVPEVVEWNRGELGECAGRPLDDGRVMVRMGDVGAAMAEAGGPRRSGAQGRASGAKPSAAVSGGGLLEKFDIILLDVDNGPEGFASETNNGLYSSKGLAVARAALREGGVLAVWSASPDAAFSERLRRAGFAVAEHRVRAQGGKGSRHQVWVATRT